VGSQLWTLRSQEIRITGKTANVALISKSSFSEKGGCQCDLYHGSACLRRRRFEHDAALAEEIDGVWAKTSKV
jgi:hypothetical protein